MLTPIQEEAVRLYGEGHGLRAVAHKLNRSHEWVRKSLKAAGIDPRSRGRVVVERRHCAECGKLCRTLRAEFCSRECFSKHRLDVAMQRLEVARKSLREGDTFAVAAEKSGFKSAWHLWGRLYHFGLTEGLRAPPEPANPES
jgi:hypothetical protein